MDKKIQSRFLSLYCMVLADGVIEAAELERLYRIGRTNYGLTVDEITACVRDKGSSFELPEGVGERIGLLYEMALIAWSDGSIDQAERELLCRYAVHCGFEEDNATAIADFLLERAEHDLLTDQVIEEALNL